MISWDGLNWDALTLALSQFHLLRPAWLLLLPLMLLLMWRLRQRQRHNDWQHFMDRELLDAVLLRSQEQHWLTPRLLSGVMFVLILLILAGPTWQKQNSPLSDDSAPLVIALELDDTMLQRDLSPHRLHHAKQKIRTLLQQRRGAATALIAYAGSAHTVLPLTEDTELLNFYLSELSPKVMPRTGNNPQLALDTALKLLPDRSGSIVFVTSRWPLPGRWQSPPPDDIAISLLAIQPEQAQGRGALLHSSGMDLTAIHLSSDDSDIKQLLANIANHWQEQHSDERLAWVDAGYYLLWPLLGLMLVWFRRGMVLQW